MTTNPQLLNALLAMDVYHRGVAGGLFGLVPDTQIDDTVRGDASPTVDTAIGFFAQSYMLNGHTIIAYRGTDDGGGTGTLDRTYGYPIALGGFQAAQATAAVAFYRSFLTAGASPLGSDIIVTGQSLGGGLAGYVGALYGVQTNVFDSMPFLDAVAAAYSFARDGFVGTGVEGSGVYVSESDYLSFRHSLYGDSPFPASAPTVSTLNGAYVKGEFIAFGNSIIPGGRPYPFEQGDDKALDAFDPSNVLDPFARHTSSSLVALMFGGGLGDLSWHASMRYLWPAWINNDIGRAIGFPQQYGEANNLYRAHDILDVAVAYTAVDHLGPYGTSAIRAMFDDANDLAHVVDSAGSSPILNSQEVDRALGEIAVQYAGDLAYSHSTAVSAQKGALDFSNNILTIDFDPTKWAATTIAGGRIIGRNRREHHHPPNQSSARDCDQPARNPCYPIPSGHGQRPDVERRRCGPISG
jgi:hypothetical protein